MRKTIIKGREAVPVRLIPFMTEGGDFAPDGLARMLAHHDGFHHVTMTAYRLLSDETYQAMRPKEWDAVITYLKVLTKKLKKEDKKEQVKNLNVEVWEKQAIEKLPSSAFVWLDDLIAAYDYVMKHTIFATYDGEFGDGVPAERPGDKELNLSPYMTFEQTEIVFEGFSSLPFTHESIAEPDLPNEPGDELESAAPVAQTHQVAKATVHQKNESTERNFSKYKPDSPIYAADFLRLTGRRFGDNGPYIISRSGVALRDYGDMFDVLSTEEAATLEESERDAKLDFPTTAKQLVEWTEMQRGEFLLPESFVSAVEQGDIEPAEPVAPTDQVTPATGHQQFNEPPTGNPEASPVEGIEEVAIQGVSEGEPRKMKKVALIAMLESEGYKNVETAFRHSGGIGGLSEAAKHQSHGYWYVDKARAWFEQEKAKAIHVKATNNPGQQGIWNGLPGITTHKMEG